MPDVHSKGKTLVEAFLTYTVTDVAIAKMLDPGLARDPSLAEQLKALQAWEREHHVFIRNLVKSELVDGFVLDLDKLLDNLRYRDRYIAGIVVADIANLSPDPAQRLAALRAIEAEGGKLYCVKNGFEPLTGADVS